MDVAYKPKIGSRTPRCQGLDKSQLMSMVYGGTTKSLRQIGTNEILKSISNDNLATNRSSHRAPTYKTQEEYYDEVISLKKTIQEMNSENSLLKLKVRRMEEDCIKQQKHVEQLLDPTKNVEMRRTLADAKPDSNSVVTSLKQKIFKLEQKLKDKESELQQLHGNIKTTKIDELNITLETLYNEISRLNADKMQTTSSKISPQGDSDKNKKVYDLKATILKINNEKNQLQTSNRTLKLDLQKCIEGQELLKKELDIILKKEKSQLTNRVASRNAEKDKKDNLTEAKYLEEIDKNKILISRLQDEKRSYKTKCEEKDFEINQMKIKLNQLEDKLGKPVPKLTKSGSNKALNDDFSKEDKKRNNSKDRINNEDVKLKKEKSQDKTATKDKSGFKSRKKNEEIYSDDDVDDDNLLNKYDDNFSDDELADIYQ